MGGRFSQLANYADLFDRSRDGILLIDIRNFEVLESNPAFLEFLKDGKVIPGTTLLECFSGNQGESVQAFLQRSVASENEPTSIDVESGESRILELTCARVQLADYCEVLQVIATDVTHERGIARQLEAQTLTDEMTGLSNFRSFQSRHLLEHERALKKNQPYSVVFFDVDHFKHFNDRNGHPAGDEALRHLARTLKMVCGRSEFVARYGGEEFVVICANATESQAEDFAERARVAVESEKFVHGEGQPLGRVSVSIGVASSEFSETPGEVLKKADEALYLSKKDGRNRVTTSQAARRKAA